MLKSKLTGLVGCTVVLVMLGLGARQAAATTYTPFTMTFDEFGNCTNSLGITCTGSWEADPTTTAGAVVATTNVWVFPLPAEGTKTGNENILDAPGVISDHLRWIDSSGSTNTCPTTNPTCATEMIFYSLDDVTLSGSFSLTIPSVPENADGTFTYTSPLGNVFTNTPLPAALPLFATGLGGLGLLGWRRKRKARAARLKLR
jgi:hypothetical protein